MERGTPKPILRCFMTLITFVMATASFGQSRDPKPLFREDIRPYGLAVVAAGRHVANYTDVTFLSDDLVLVAVNMREFARVSPLFADKPPSKLLLFDLSQKRLVRSIELPVEKDSGSIRATQNGQFALLDRAGVRICSVDLECGQAFPTQGPLLVSPGGTRLAVGGNAETGQKLLDSATLKEIGSFPYQNPAVVPGDGGLLLRYGNKQYLRLPGKRDYPIGSHLVSASQFLNDKNLVGFERNEAAVVRMDGTVLYLLRVRDAWSAGFVAAAAGTRFCIHEWGYTRWNSIVNFYDIDEGRPPNFEKVRVIATDTGKRVFQLEWDPRAYGPVAPALSPNGHRVAIVRGGYLDVFDVP
jgi:hypothetical protein